MDWSQSHFLSFIFPTVDHFYVLFLKIVLFTVRIFSSILWTIPFGQRNIDPQSLLFTKTINNTWYSITARNVFASQLHDPWFDPEMCRIPSVFPVPVWVSSRFSGFLPLPQIMPSDAQLSMLNWSYVWACVKDDRNVFPCPTQYSQETLWIQWRLKETDISIW